MDCDRETRAAALPHQSGPAIGRLLRRYAAEVRPGHAIVELGVWLGYGTAQLALGAGPEVEVHGFDHFHAHSDSRAKAARWGIALRSKQDTLPLVREHLEGFGVSLHKGAITEAGWGGPHIGLYVDDACKRRGQFLGALRIFAPWWVAGETVLVLMDFYYFKRKPAVGLDFQHRYVTARPEVFARIGEPVGSTAVFRYKGGLMV